MIKIIMYDVKRLIFTKVYAALLMITLVFSYFILSNLTILGTACTAPFSEWSYASFLLSILPFLMMSILLFCTYVFSKKELAVRTITVTSPLSCTGYCLSKIAAILLACLITVIMVVALSFIFYAGVFNFYDFGSLIYPVFLFLVPPVIFMQGLGMLAGMKKVGSLYVIMVISFTLGNAGGIFGDYGLFCKVVPECYPYQLAADASGEVPFLLPQGFLLSRILWIVAGLILSILVLKGSNKKTEI